MRHTRILAEDQENGARRAVNIGQVDAAPSGPSGEGKGKSVSLRQSQHVPSQPSNRLNVEPPAATSENTAKPRYRTGTGPFMALELLRSNPPPAHRYRYDVESFFYLYVCGAATYRADGDERIFVIKDWNYDSLRRIGTEKLQFLVDAEQYTKVFEGAHADFKPAIAGFLLDMWLTFQGVCQLSQEIAKIITFRSLRRLPTVEDEKLIADKRQAQDDKVTYQAFMKMMGEPELLAEASGSPSA
ncbi:hypothetical protein FOMPIDRAFT_1050041 [Fomitopsis schrenkii]|uniref:Fungal-type protein kinase domain-containing protein n=1 Tax=Fomitopsis schrenkii TaxID=2126942 RepID=S8E598_FOMSC|nr:hypothetical protein FOMPIDRAFT_1050041 [Fomitopsis schrenkii]